MFAIRISVHKKGSAIVNLLLTLKVMSRKIILCMHTSLDGFVAGPNGEMDWIIVDDELFDYVGQLTDQADTALYGRVTYQMMDGYWPNAADQPNASKHDIEHSRWYNEVDKIVLSRTLQKQADKLMLISDDIAGKINSIKRRSGKNILIFGSPTAVRALIKENLIDDYLLFVNPVILGGGIPLFADLEQKIKLKRLSTKELSSGVTAMSYTVDR
jgi:Dihydrofolate reductase